MVLVMLNKDTAFEVKERKDVDYIFFNSQSAPSFTIKYLPYNLLA